MNIEVDPEQCTVTKGNHCICASDLGWRCGEWSVKIAFKGIFLYETDVKREPEEGDILSVHYGATSIGQGVIIFND